MFKFYGQLLPDDLVNAQALHFKLQGRARVLPFVLAAIVTVTAILLLLLTLVFGPRILAFALFFFFLLALYPVNKYILFPRQIRRAYHQSVLYSAPQEIEIDNTAVKITNKSGYTERPWTAFIKWKEDAQTFLLYHTDTLYTILPTHFFADNEQRDFIRMQLNDHNVPRAGTPVQVIFGYILITISCLFLLGMILVIGN